MTLTPAIRATLATVTTATLTTVLLKKGLRNVWIRGSAPLSPGFGRRVGTAFTLRFVPYREDLASPASWSSPTSTRAAIEAMPEGVIAVADAMGDKNAGIFGDILCARMANEDFPSRSSCRCIADRSFSRGLNLPCTVPAPSLHFPPLRYRLHHHGRE